jgi:hypothetical protein
MMLKGYSYQEGSHMFGGGMEKLNRIGRPGRWIGAHVLQAC